jgi:hypothetical protein
LEGILDGALPSVEYSHEVGDHFLVDLGISGGVDGLDIGFPLGVVFIQIDLVGKGFGSLLKLTGKLIEDNIEIVPLIVLTDAPV